MFYVYIVRKDEKYFVQLINSVVSSTGIKTSAVLSESKIGMSADMAVECGEKMIDAFIHAGMSVQPSLGLKEEGVGHEG